MSSACVTTPPGSRGIHPLVDALADVIRSRWQELPDLEGLAVDPALEAISGALDGDDLFIRNELRRCHGLRKLHLETARLGSGLQILHCVFFPDPRFDLPVFGADIVAGRAGVSAAIVDLSPVDGCLAPGLDAALAALPERVFRERRALPGWGSIFSPHVCFVRPVDVQEEHAFVAQVDAVLRLLSDAVRRSAPQPTGDPATVRRWEGQLRYCKQQKQNDKTRRVLEKAFDIQWADRYIETLLFDDPPRP